MQQESLDVLQRAIEVVYQQQYDSLETGVPAPTKEGLRSIPIGDVTCLFRVKELVFTPEQGCLRQLTTVLNALHSAGGSCLMLLQCQGGKIELYLGVVNKQRCANPYYLHTLREILRSGLEGNLPGTRLEEVVARSEVDAQLRKAIREHYAGTTTVIIAQRITSVMNTDQIVILEDGRIHAVGTHKSLLESDPIYQEIYASQMKGGEDCG